ncbi:MAG: DNA methyltransferase, partial [Geodermatophilaceae bacterium]
MSAHPATTGSRIVTAPAYDRWGVTVHEGDCLDVLRQFPDEHFAAVVTDPPYSYRFMNKIWDAHESPLAFQQWCEGWARECLRVLKPGGIMLSFGGTRTSHRLTCGIEDAGFEIRDSIDWLYAGGMPKGINISKEIDRIAGAEREVIGTNVYGDGHVQRSTESIGYGGCDPATDTRLVTAPATDAARQWEGWNTQLRPAHEPIVVARKPFRGTVAGNVLEHGTGGLHVDATRVAANGRKLLHTVTHGPATPGTSTFATGLSRPSYLAGYTDQGRYPPNVVLSHVPSVDPATGE